MALIALDCEVPDDRGDRRVLPAGPRALPVPDAQPARAVRQRGRRAARPRAREFAVERCGVDPAEDLERIEEGGRLDLDRYGGARPARARSSPAWPWQLARLRFGTVGPTNHFVELQGVEEVLDPERGRGRSASARAS